MSKIQVSLKIDAGAGLNILEQLSQKLPEAHTLGIQRVALYFRDNCVLMAQAGHPEHPNVITGRLSGSMRYKMLSSGIHASVEVGSDAEYAPYVEMGHMSRSWGSDSWHAVPAYPWFQPAISQTFDSGDAQQIFNNTVGEVLGK